MSNLGMKELVLGATLALTGTPADAKPNAAAEAVLRAHCAQVAETARREVRSVIDSLEFRTGSMAFAPDHAAKKAEASCLEEMGVVEPKADNSKK